VVISAILPPRDITDTMFACRPSAEPEPLIYREEVLGIIGALADIIVELRWFHEFLEGDDEAEEEQGGA
jgi:hypothetical protein